MKEEEEMYMHDEYKAVHILVVFYLPEGETIIISFCFQLDSSTMPSRICSTVNVTLKIKKNKNLNPPFCVLNLMHLSNYISNQYKSISSRLAK